MVNFWMTDKTVDRNTGFSKNWSIENLVLKDFTLLSSIKKNNGSLLLTIWIWNKNTIISDGMFHISTTDNTAFWIDKKFNRSSEPFQVLHLKVLYQIQLVTFIGYKFWWLDVFAS